LAVTYPFFALLLNLMKFTKKATFDDH